MVRDKKIALGAGARRRFPAANIRRCSSFLSRPSPGHSIEENEKALYDIIDGVKKEKVDAGIAATRKNQAARRV